jgi:hypothetical protein
VSSAGEWQDLDGDLRMGAAHLGEVSHLGAHNFGTADDLVQRCLSACPLP